VITSSKRNPLSVHEVIFTHSLPDYPKTHPNGIAYVVNLQGMTPEEKKSQFSNVIYSESIPNPF
jgi:hypothetical protein